MHPLLEKAPRSASHHISTDAVADLSRITMEDLLDTTVSWITGNTRSDFATNIGKISRRCRFCLLSEEAGFLGHCGSRK